MSITNVLMELIVEELDSIFIDKIYLFPIANTGFE